MAQGPASCPAPTSLKQFQDGLKWQTPLVWCLRGHSASELGSFPPSVPESGFQAPGITLCHPTSPSAEGDWTPFFALSLSFPSPKQRQIKSGEGCGQQSGAQASSGFSPSSTMASKWLHFSASTNSDGKWG